MLVLYKYLLTHWLILASIQPLQYHMVDHSILNYHTRTAQIFFLSDLCLTPIYAKRKEVA